MTRKSRFAATLAVLLLLSVLHVPAIAAAGGGSTTDDPWARLPGILARIQPPAFPARDFPITDFGAVGDGVTDATSALTAAIEACHSSGGGRVIVPPGEFVTGPVRLLSNVNLHISGGSHASLQYRSRAVSPGRLHPLGRRRVDELRAAGLRLRAEERGHHRQWDA